MDPGAATVAMVARCVRHQHPEEFGGEGVPAPDPEVWRAAGPREPAPASGPCFSEWCDRCGINHGAPDGLGTPWPDTPDVA